MTDQQSLLQAVCADPEDIDLRLVYSDWLTDQGDPRGDFIRVQVRLAGSLSAAETYRLRQRERELLQRHAVEWLGRGMSRLKRWIFRRGFVEEIELRADTFLKDGCELLAREPVTSVRLQGAIREIQALACSPLLARLKQLDLSFNYLNDPAIEVLATSTHLGRLNALQLRNNFLRDRGARSLAESTLSPALFLDLTGNLIGGTGRQALHHRFGETVRI
jgi:uncharacterized protein (TIGR02996 family)